tara:strand:+ start:12657 stop:13877 length:1221 start_codon:yes stop_codon:yes gene_type:complete
MTAGVDIHPPGSIKTAMGWILLAVTLCQYLYPTDAAVALFGCVIAELSSRLLVAGLDRSQSDDATDLRLEDILGYILLRWVLFSMSTLILAQIYSPGFFEDHQYAFGCILGLCLNLALIRVVCAYRTTAQKRGALLAQMRNTVLSGGVLVVAQFGSLNCDLVLSLAIALLLAILVTLSVGVSFISPIRQGNMSASAQIEKTLLVAAPLLFRYADVVILSWVLSPLNTLNYLIARGLAQGVSIALNLLSNRIAETLISAYDTENSQEFAAVAARTNLGFLLIGGSVSVAAISGGASIPMFFGIDAEVFQNILFWLVAAEAAPVIFGATGLLLNIAHCSRETILLSLFGALAVWSALIILDISNPRQLAQVFAYVQLLIAATSAFLLGLRFGIWPGLTAILFRQIKLL